jgi:DNA polymerase-3 subunit epsilon
MQILKMKFLVSLVVSISNFKNYFWKKRLKNERFLSLIETPPDNEFVVFDTETTGLNQKKDSIISIGAIKIINNKIKLSESLHIYLTDEKESSEEAIKVHKIREIDRVSGVSEKDAIEKFVDFVGSRPLIGYYLEFDIAMVNKLFREISGVSFPNKQIEVSELYYAKKSREAKRVDINLSFDSISKELKIPNFGKHDALNDALMTALIYLKLQKG